MPENLENSAIARFGYVSDYDATRHMARIIFPDKDNLPSNWLPVLVHNSLRNQDNLHLDINEHVFCIMLGNGIETGIVVGAIYDDANKPENSDKDTRKIKFEDGTEILYDRKKHELNINCSGTININAQSIAFNGGGLFKVRANKIDEKEI